MNTNRIFILGDSFCDTHWQDYNNFDWVDTDTHHIKWNQWLKWEYPSIEIINDAAGSRDLQTIIDNWIKFLPKLKSDDFLIICVPFYLRQRVPLRPDDYMIKDWSEGTVINRFVTHHSWYTSDSQKIYVDNNAIIEKKEMDHHIKFFENLMACHAPQENYTEVIESLYAITPSKKYLFSWDTPNPKPFCLDDKNDLTEKLGMWTTLANLYDETNGKLGHKGDFHWDYRTEKRFFEHIKNMI
jgi:hypothetical protein